MLSSGVTQNILDKIYWLTFFGVQERQTTQLKSLGSVDNDDAVHIPMARYGPPGGKKSKCHLVVRPWYHVSPR